MSRYIYILVSFFCILSCSTQKNVSSKAFLYYGKTKCLGKCPVFDMYFFDNGKVMYEGFENVEVIGKKELKISSEDIRFLKNELEKVNFSQETSIKRDIPNTILRYNDKKLITQNRESIKVLLEYLEKVSP